MTKKKSKAHQREEHKMQEQEQTQGEQSQKQAQPELPPDPVHEQRHAYTQPEQGLASDPIVEAPKAEPEQEPAKEEPK